MKYRSTARPRLVAFFWCFAAFAFCPVTSRSIIPASPAAGLPARRGVDGLGQLHVDIQLVVVAEQVREVRDALAIDPDFPLAVLEYVTSEGDRMHWHDHLEIALVLDTTKSMEGSRLASIKTAAGDLVDRFLAAERDEHGWTG